MLVEKHIIALDNYNNIYTWDTGCQSNVGVMLEFPGISSNSSNFGRVIKISAGWNLSAALIDNYGLIVWYTRIGITEEQFHNREFISQAKYFIIPFTKNDIIDFTVGSNFVMFIRKSDEKLYQTRFNVHEIATRDDTSNLTIDEIKQFTNQWIILIIGNSNNQKIIKKILDSLKLLVVLMIFPFSLIMIKYY